jgi:hypothetical protein
MNADDKVIETIRDFLNKRSEMSDLQFYKELYKSINPRSRGRPFKNAKLTYVPNDKVGSKTALEWYNLYVQQLSIVFEAKRQDRPRLNEDQSIPYPFKSKRSKYLKAHPETVVEVRPTTKLIKKKFYEKPSFSKYHGTWEIDIVEHLIDPATGYHLFCINVNTKYLFVYPLRSKNTYDIAGALTKFFDDVAKQFPSHDVITDEFKNPVRYVKGDGERGFDALINSGWLNSKVKDFSFDSSKFTNHNRVVDSVIRTIRNAINDRIINERQLQQIIEYYNHTYHKSIDCTPFEMMSDPEHKAEDQYIRYCTAKLLEVKRREQAEGLLDYQFGNVLLLHVDLAKTPQIFSKKRRFWNRIGEFIEYEGGSVHVKLLGAPLVVAQQNGNEVHVNEIDLPIQYTSLIAKNKNEIPEYYHDYYVF